MVASPGVPRVDRPMNPRRSAVVAAGAGPLRTPSRCARNPKVGPLNVASIIKGLSGGLAAIDLSQRAPAR